MCLYDAALWTNFKVRMLNKLRSCYNRCIKIFFGYSRRDSVTSILFNLGLPSFDTLMKMRQCLIHAHRTAAATA